jgi:hypothetical protein
MNISVRLGRKTAVLPANSTSISDATVRAATLKGMVCLVGAVDPGVEQSNVAGSTASARAKCTNKVSSLEVLPGDFFGDTWETDGIGPWSGSVESHGDETRAIGAVVGALWVWVFFVHGVRDVVIDPGLAAGDNFVAGDLAVHSGGATAAVARARARDHAGGAGFHIVVCNIAAIRCLIPERVAINGFANNLAGNFNIVTLLVCHNNFGTG